MEIKFEYGDMLRPKEYFNEEVVWYAQDQLTALKYYLRPAVKVLREFKQDTWQGDCFALLEFKETLVLWRDSFGSCSGCDALDGRDQYGGYDYIKSTMVEGNCKRFDSMEEMKEWLLCNRDYLWSALKEHYADFREPKKESD